MAGEGDDEIFNVIGEVYGNALGGGGLGEVGPEDMDPEGDFLWG